MIDHSIPVLHPIRRTKVEWDNNQNYILKSGQLGICTDESTIVIGNGVSKYSELTPIKTVYAIDSLNDGSTTQPLSANQGKILAKELLKYTLYVDSANGEDSEESGTSTNPYKTLEYALSHCPTNNDVSVKLKTGEYAITGAHSITNTKFEIIGINGQEENKPIISISHNINAVNTGTFECQNQGMCKFSNISFTSDSGSVKAKTLINSTYRTTGIIVDNCDFESFETPIRVESTNADISNCSFSNCETSVNNLRGIVTSYNNHSTDCTYGFKCSGGNIYYKNNIQPIGINGNLIDECGEIIGTSGIIYVDSTNGDDSSGNGESENPLKSITRAVNLLPTKSDGEYTISIAVGEYRENSLDISNKCTTGSINIVGEDPENVSTIKCTSSGDSAIFVCNNTNNNSTNVNIRNVLIRSNDIGNFVNTGILAKSSKNLNIDNVEIQYLKTGILIEKALGPSTISDLKLSNITENVLITKNCQLVKISNFEGNINVNRNIANYSSVILSDNSPNLSAINDDINEDGVIFRWSSE